MNMLRFDGRVAVVTGAGQGIGREYALLLASRGASVVVNDLGCDVEGYGMSVESADSVVAEIRAAGGTAVASYADVRVDEEAKKVVQSAIDNFGKLDILINNAGIFKSASFLDMPFEDVERHVESHMYAAVHMSKAAWPYLAESQSGRIVSATSNAGLFGSVDTAAYASAKAGVFGLTRTLALEGVDVGINVNALGPAAWTRMAKVGVKESLSPEALAFAEAAMPPAGNAAVVAYLVHDSCGLTGEALSFSGQRLGRFVIAETDGFMTGSHLTPEDVAERIDEVMSTDRQHLFRNVEELVAYTQDQIRAQNIDIMTD